MNEFHHFSLSSPLCVWSSTKKELIDYFFFLTRCRKTQENLLFSIQKVGYEKLISVFFSLDSLMKKDIKSLGPNQLFTCVFFHVQKITTYFLVFLSKKIMEKQFNKWLKFYFFTPQHQANSEPICLQNFQIQINTLIFSL